MRVGIAYGTRLPWGPVPGGKVTYRNLPGLREALLEGGAELVAMLTELRGNVPPYLAYEPDTDTRELILDAVLFGDLSQNALFCREASRAWWAMSRAGGAKLVELVRYSEPELKFKPGPLLRRIENIARSEDPHFKERFIRYAKLVAALPEAEKARPCQHSCVYNKNEGPATFPFSLLAAGELVRCPHGSSEQPSRHVYEEAGYVGKLKPRVLDLPAFNVPVRAYVANDAAHARALQAQHSDGLLTFVPRTTYSCFQRVLGEHRCVIVNLDPGRSNVGWVMQRVLESVWSGVPVIAESGVFEGRYGFTPIPKDSALLFSVKPEMVQVAWAALGEPGLRAEVWQAQLEFVDQVVSDFRAKRGQALVEAIVNS